MQDVHSSEAIENNYDNDDAIVNNRKQQHVFIAICRMMRLKIVSKLEIFTILLLQTTTNTTTLNLGQDEKLNQSDFPSSNKDICKDNDDNMNNDDRGKAGQAGQDDKDDLVLCVIDAFKHRYLGGNNSV